MSRLDERGSAGQTVGMPRSKWSLWSTNSVLSIGSYDSALSIASVGSFASIGSIGSALSIGSTGSVLSMGSTLSAGSRWSLMSYRSFGAVGAAGKDRARSPLGPPAILAAVAVVAWAGYRRERTRHL